ncbi:MAG: hypothetical protein CL949_03255 [Erythrobacter sp.]|nr:hypothetical protein [Erythrobacter sp.]
MTGNRSRHFTARPGDEDRWIRAGGPAVPGQSATAFTARLTIDVTPDMRRRLKLAAITRGSTVAEMLRALLEREFPDDEGEMR